MKKNNNTLAIILVIFIAIIGGGAPVFVKIGLKQIPPFTYTFVRFLIAFLCILPFFLREKPTINKHTLVVVLFSLLATANITFFAFGIRLTSAIVGQMLYAAVPIIVGLISFSFLKDRLSGDKILGIILGFVGTLLIIFLPVIGKPSVIKGNLLGNVLIMIGVISYAIYTTFSKKMQKTYSPTYVTTMFFLTTGVVEFILGITELTRMKNIISVISTESVVSVFYVGILASFVFYLLYQYAIKHSTPLITSMLFYVQPIATVIWAAVLLGEKLTTGFIIGSVLSLFGAWLVTKK